MIAMNLIQVADRLKELPNSPQTTQLLTAYANGASAVVPPFLALTELQRRTRLAQERASAQPPAGTVKDQIEQQASGIGALAQMGQMMPPQTQPLPQATPQPASEGEQPVQAARGGLMGLSVRPSMYNYGSGGIIAFAGGDEVEDDEEDDEDTGGGGDEVARVPTAATQARFAPTRAAMDVNELRNSIRQIDAAGGIEDLIRAQTRKPGEGGAMTSRDMVEEARRRYEERLAQRPAGQTYLEERKALLEKNPELAAALADKTGEQLARFDEIQALRRAEIEKQRQEAAAAKPGILQLLGQAALGTRGQFGRSALGALLGGYGQMQSAADARALEQEQARRAKEIDLSALRADLLTKIDDVKKAKAEGDVAKEMQASKEAAQAKLRYDIAASQEYGRTMTAAGNVARGELSAASRDAAARTRADAERFKAQESTRRAAATAAEATRRALSPKGKEAFATRIAGLRAAGKDEEADRLIKDYNRLSGTTAGVGAINAQRAILNTRLKEVNSILSSKNLDATDEEKAAAKVERDEILGALKELQTPGTQPAAPAVLSMPTGAPDKVREQLKTGAVYDTARGPAKWDGSKFVSVK